MRCRKKYCRGALQKRPAYGKMDLLRMGWLPKSADSAGGSLR